MTVSSSSSSKTTKKSKSKSKSKTASSPSLRAYLQQSPSKENPLAARSGPGAVAADPNASSKSSVEKMSLDIAKIMVPFKR
ncbi:hypothetical protein PG989_003112 [Apiospora arundinis]